MKKKEPDYKTLYENLQQRIVQLQKELEYNNQRSEKLQRLMAEQEQMLTEVEESVSIIKILMLSMRSTGVPYI